MPPKQSNKAKKMTNQLANIEHVIQDPSQWSINGPYMENLEKLLRLMAELEGMQKGFELVDSKVSWEIKSQRLLNWLRSHPSFECKALEMVNTLPVERGCRGVVLKEPLKKEESAFKIPQACMLSTATAVRTSDLGSVLQEERLMLTDLPTIVLALHLMVEHCKSLIVAGEGAAVTADIPVPVEDLKPLPPDTLMPGRASHGHGHPHGGSGDDHGHAHGGDHGHPHGGEGHGHSHGGKPCHGHGGDHGHPHGEEGHGHSHGGKPCHGHGEEAAPKKPAHSHDTAPKKAGHGHSHGGKPCHGHGDDAAPEEPLRARTLDTKSHPWGSKFRAYIATLPEEPTSCLYFTFAQLKRLDGFPLQHELATFICNTVRTYIRLFHLFGTEQGEIIDGFEDYFTWSHFKWAISCSMSRQNHVPNPIDDGYSMALIPLYDMVNATPGPVTSFFFGDDQYLVLDAVKDFAAGEELLMSYGNRDSHKMLQFSGFVIEESSATDHALVEAVLAGLDSDPLFKIRVNVLNSLFITPEHNAKRYLMAPDAQQQLRAIQTHAGRDAKPLIEKFVWAQPFMFQIKVDGTPSVDLISFLRVAAMNTKAEAAEALKQCDAARRTIITKREEAEERRKQRVAKKLHERAARKDAGPVGGESLTGEEDDSDEEDEQLEFQLVLNQLSPVNEVIANEMLCGILRHTISLTGEDPAAETVTPAAAGAKGYDPVEAYRSAQIGILKASLKQAEGKFAESKAAAIAGAGAKLA